MEFLEVDGVMMLKVYPPLAEKDANALRAYADHKFEQGAAAERKRIIKLLETQAEVTGYVEIELGKLIALIKGENNVA